MSKLCSSVAGVAPGSLSSRPRGRLLMAVICVLALVGCAL